MSDTLPCRSIADDLSAYVDAEVDAARALEIERHVEQCASCRSAVAALREVAGRVAALPRRAAPAALADSVARAVRQPAVTRTPFGRRGVRIGVRVATAAALIVFGMALDRVMTRQATPLETGNLPSAAPGGAVVRAPIADRSASAKKDADDRDAAERLGAGERESLAFFAPPAALPPDRVGGATDQFAATVTKSETPAVRAVEIDAESGLVATPPPDAARGLAYASNEAGGSPPATPDAISRLSEVTLTVAPRSSAEYDRVLSVFQHVSSPATGGVGGTHDADTGKERALEAESYSVGQMQLGRPMSTTGAPEVDFNLALSIDSGQVLDLVGAVEQAAPRQVTVDMRFTAQAAWLLHDGADGPAAGLFHSGALQLEQPAPALTRARRADASHATEDVSPRDEARRTGDSEDKQARADEDVKDAPPAVKAENRPRELGAPGAGRIAGGGGGHRGGAAGRGAPRDEPPSRRNVPGDAPEAERDPDGATSGLAKAPWVEHFVREGEPALGRAEPANDLRAKRRLVESDAGGAAPLGENVAEWRLTTMPAMGDPARPLVLVRMRLLAPPSTAPATQPAAR